jgi:hypothetical protein
VIVGEEVGVIVGEEVGVIVGEELGVIVEMGIQFTYLYSLMAEMLTCKDWATGDGCRLGPLFAHMTLAVNNWRLAVNGKFK